MTDYISVLTRNYPGAQWTIGGNDYSSLVWHDDTPQPTQDELDAAWPAVRDAQAWDRVRVERDRLLAASDWTQVADAPLADAQKYAWAAYRQTLRNIPQDYATPDEVVWPIPPA